VAHLSEFTKWYDADSKFNSRSGEGWVFWAQVWFAQARRARLSEMWWWSHYWTLAHVRWGGLSEANGLAWANSSSLSEYTTSFMFVGDVWTVW